MYQVAHRKQQNADIKPNATHGGDRTFAIAVGKATRAEQEDKQHLGAPDFYSAAIDSAMREIAAIRSTALPAYVRALRTKDAAPLARETAIARAAMQVRHLLLTANKHVYALEESQVRQDSMVDYLRRALRKLVAQSVKLGVYRNAKDMIPQGYVEPKKPEKTTLKHKPVKTQHKLADTRSSLTAGTQAAIVRSSRQQNQDHQNVEGHVSKSRLSRGTGAPGGSNGSNGGSIFSGGAGRSSEPRENYVRPGFRK